MPRNVTFFQDDDTFTKVQHKSFTFIQTQYYSSVYFSWKILRSWSTLRFTM